MIIRCTFCRMSLLKTRKSIVEPQEVDERGRPLFVVIAKERRGELPVCYMCFRSGTTSNKIEFRDKSQKFKYRYRN